MRTLRSQSLHTFNYSGNNHIANSSHAGRVAAGSAPALKKDTWIGAA